MNLINFDFLLKTVLPKLFISSLLSFFIALVLGGLIGWVATVIARNKSCSRPAPNLVLPTMFGSFVGMMLIGFLPIEANPASLIGGPYGALWYMALFIVLAPLGILLGAGLGISLGTKLTAQRKYNVGKWGIVATYAIATAVMYFSLVPPPLRMTAGSSSSDPFPVLAQFSGYEKGVEDLSFSPDGKSLSMKTVDGVYIWDLEARQIKAFTEPGSTLKTLTQNVSFSVNGEQVFTVAPQEIQVRNLKTGEILQRLDGGNEVYPTADGQQLVGIDSKKPYGLKVWDLKTYKLNFTIPAQFGSWEAKGKAIALSQDSRTLVLSPGLSDNRIEVWDIKAGKKLKSFNENGKAGITSMAITPDNQQLVTAAGNTLFLWDLNQEKLLRTIPKVGAVRMMVFSSSGLVTAAEDRLDLWDIKTGKSLKTVKHKPPGIITFALKPDGKAFSFYRYSDKLVKIWKLP